MSHKGGDEVLTVKKLVCEELVVRGPMGGPLVESRAYGNSAWLGVTNPQGTAGIACQGDQPPYVILWARPDAENAPSLAFSPGKNGKPFLQIATTENGTRVLNYLNVEDLFKFCSAQRSRPDADPDAGPDLSLVPGGGAG